MTSTGFSIQYSCMYKKYLKHFTSLNMAWFTFLPFIVLSASLLFSEVLPWHFICKYIVP
jgi:hypothetical protein